MASLPHTYPQPAPLLLSPGSWVQVEVPEASHSQPLCVHAHMHMHTLGLQQVEGEACSLANNNPGPHALRFLPHSSWAGQLGFRVTKSSQYCQLSESFRPSHLSLGLGFSMDSWMVLCAQPSI